MKPAGAVERHLESHVACDGLLIEPAKYHLGGVEELVHGMLVVPDEGDRRQERYGGTRAGLQLLDATRFGTGLAEEQLSQRAGSYRDLVGAYDPGVGVLQRHSGGFSPGEARCKGYRSFAAATRLVDSRRTTGEGQAQPCQELAPIFRG